MPTHIAASGHRPTRTHHGTTSDHGTTMEPPHRTMEPPHRTHHGTTSAHARWRIGIPLGSPPHAWYMRARTARARPRRTHHHCVRVLARSAKRYQPSAEQRVNRQLMPNVGLYHCMLCILMWSQGCWLTLHDASARAGYSNTQGGRAATHVCPSRHGLVLHGVWRRARLQCAAAVQLQALPVWPLFLRWLDDQDGGDPSWIHDP